MLTSIFQMYFIRLLQNNCSEGKMSEKRKIVCSLWTVTINFSCVLWSVCIDDYFIPKENTNITKIHRGQIFYLCYRIHHHNTLWNWLYLFYRWGKWGERTIIFNIFGCNSGNKFLKKTNLVFLFENEQFWIQNIQLFQLPNASSDMIFSC